MTIKKIWYFAKLNSSWKGLIMHMDKVYTCLLRVLASFMISFQNILLSKIYPKSASALK
jgi:hypothetical protein